MKSKKKLLLLGVGAMGALAMGVGATSTFAWFTAQQAANVTALTNNTNDLIRVSDNAELSGTFDMRIKINWSSLTAVDLTAGAPADADGENVAQVIGGAYVIDQGGHVKANTASVTKVRDGYLTLSSSKGTALAPEIETYTGSAWRLATNDEIARLLNKTITVKLTASDQLRVCADQALVNGAVGASETYTGSAITIGTAKVNAVSEGVITWLYDSEYDINDETADAALNFRYSASPKYATSTGEATNVAYGTLTATFTVA